MLGPGELRQVATAVRIALEARRVLEAAGELAPLSAELLAPLDPSLAALADSIDRCVVDDGADLRDTASPQLRRLRAELRTGRQRVTEEITRVARSSELRRVPPGAVRHGARRTAGARREDVCPRKGAGRRPRLVELGADALRRAVRDCRAEQPARRGTERRARGGRADPARAVGPRRRPRRRARAARRGDRRARRFSGLRDGFTPLARRRGRGGRPRAAARRAASAARPSRPPFRSTSTSARCACSS